MTTTYQAGQPYTVTGEYYNEAGAGGVLVDPTGGVSLTITYGSGGDVVAGPIPYAGASAPTDGQLYRVGPGVYAYDWLVPYSAAAGVYVMNWTFTDGPFGTVYEGFENVTVLGGGVTPTAGPDTGFWTGSLTGGGVTIPLGGVDDNGVGWALLKVDGWDSPDTVGSVAQYGGDHGGIPSPQYYAPRMVTLSVWACAPSHAARDEARAMMQQAATVSDLGLFVYDEPVPKQAAVRRSGRLIESCPTLFDVVFSVLLIAPDPRKYGTQTRTVTASANLQSLGLAAPLTAPVALPAQPPAGSATVTNAGRFETRPTVTVSGPITAPALYNQTSGQTVKFSTLTLAASDRLTVDFQAKLAYLNGSPRFADLASAWWTLTPGVTQIVLQGGGTGAQMTITYQDAWM